MAELALQQPAPGHFSYYDLAWTPVTHRPPPAAGEKPEAVTVQQAKIPWDRVRDFITGEEARGACNFYVRGGQTKKPEQLQKATRRDSHSEFRIYHCVHGPEDDSVLRSGNGSGAASQDAGTGAAAAGGALPDVGAAVMDSQTAADGAAAAAGAGTEGGIAIPGTAAGLPPVAPQPQAQPKRKNKRMRGEGARVGCQVRFKVARPVAEPTAARITWLGSLQHANKEGRICHGPGCEAAAANPRLAMATHLSSSAKNWVAAQLRANIPRADIVKRNQMCIRAAVTGGAIMAEDAFQERLRTYPAAHRDYLLKTQDIDNIAKRLNTFPLPPEGAEVVHPASLGTPASMPQASMAVTQQQAQQPATYSAMLADGTAGAAPQQQPQALAPVPAAQGADPSGAPPARRHRTGPVPVPKQPATAAEVHEMAQRILNALAAAPPDVHKALLGVVAPTLEALWQRIMQMVPAIAADVAPSGDGAMQALPAAAQLPQPQQQVGQYAAHSAPQPQQPMPQQLHPMPQQQVPPPLPSSLMPPTSAEAVGMAMQQPAAYPSAAAGGAAAVTEGGVPGSHPAYPDPGAVTLPIAGDAAAAQAGYAADAATQPQLDAMLAAAQQQQQPQQQQPTHVQQQPVQDQPLQQQQQQDLGGDGQQPQPMQQ